MGKSGPVTDPFWEGGDPLLSPLLDALYPISQMEGVSWDESQRAFVAGQPQEALEFSIDIYPSENTRGPGRFLYGYYQPQAEIFYLLFQDGQLCPVWTSK